MKIQSVSPNMSIHAPHNSQPKIARQENSIDPKSGEVIQTVSDSTDYEVQGTADVEEEKGVVPSEEENKLMAKSVDQANQSLKLYDRKLELSIHEVTKTVMYTLRDTKTNEVIAEFPPKKIQDMVAKMWELAGLFVDKRA